MKQYGSCAGMEKLVVPIVKVSISSSMDDTIISQNVTVTNAKQATDGLRYDKHGVSVASSTVIEVDIMFIFHVVKFIECADCARIGFE